MKTLTPVDIKLDKKTVFIRLDLDVNLNQGKVENDNRLVNALKTIHYCLDRADRLILAGHRGRPESHFDPALSTHLLIDYLSDLIGQPVTPLKFGSALFSLSQSLQSVKKENNKLYLLENLRFWPEEEQNSPALGKLLVEYIDVYVNEAFAASHRKHASVHALPHYLSKNNKDSVFGYHFAQEIKQLSQVFISTKNPKLISINGKKDDKLDHLPGLKNLFDRILVGGRLPEYLPEDFKDSKVVVARLIQDKSDITINSMENFEKEIKKAKIIVLSGPISRYEEEGHDQGTIRILQAIADNKNAIKIAGGGDTEAAIKKFDFTKAFNWISTGGGAMLEYLSTGTLPVLEI